MSYVRNLVREKQCLNKVMSGSLHHYGKVICSSPPARLFWRKRILGSWGKNMKNYFKCFLIFYHGMEQVLVRYTFDLFLNSLGLIFNLQIFRLNLLN